MNTTNLASSKQVGTIILENYNTLNEEEVETKQSM